MTIPSVDSRNLDEQLAEQRAIQEQHSRYVTAQGRYHEVAAQVATRIGATPFEGHLETLTNERTGAVYFRIKSNAIELTAMVDDTVKLEQIALSILAIARSKR